MDERLRLVPAAPRQSSIEEPEIKGLDEIHKLVRERLAQSKAPILIHGESGTGKELIARALHVHSLRKDRPFIPVSLSALAAGIIESELFGHVRGAFTGAVGRRDGFFVAADNGTIFLDEISEMSPDVQVKILRVIDNGEVTPVGSNRVINVQPRIVAATNKDLEQEMRAHRFREDLYYRLNVIPIKLPPLRERPMDEVKALIDFFMAKYSAAEDRKPPVTSIEDAAIERLLQYRWPGNVRELQNAIQRACVLCTGDTIKVTDLPQNLVQPEEPNAQNSNIEFVRAIMALLERNDIDPLRRFRLRNPLLTDTAEARRPSGGQLKKALMQVAIRLRELGLAEGEIAELLGVSQRILLYWRKK